MELQFRFYERVVVCRFYKSCISYMVYCLASADSCIRWNSIRYVHTSQFDEC